MFVPGRPFQPNLMFVCKVRSLPKTAAPERYFSQEAPALLASIRLGWKCLPGTNTNLNYEHFKITSIKSLISLGTGDNMVIGRDVLLKGKAQYD